MASTRKTAAAAAPSRVRALVRSPGPSRAVHGDDAPLPAIWEVVPDAADAQRIAERCRRMVKQRALIAAGVAMVPIPGLDWVTDVGLLVKLLPKINEAFGLTPEQVERLAPERRIVIFKAISAGSSVLVGKLITRELVISVLTIVGVRLTTQQAAKFVPLAGQAVSAVLTFGALRQICEMHIQQCLAICEEAHAAVAEPIDAVDPKR